MNGIKNYLKNNFKYYIGTFCIDLQLQLIFPLN